MDNPKTLRDGLSQYTGTETWFRHNLNRKVLYTEGVQFFAENAGGGAYWFLDIIATEGITACAGRPFMIVTLKVENKKATITGADDTDIPPFWTKEVMFTDCPEGEWVFYFIDNILLLPSEY
jgi:hypothetical protein